MAEHGDPSFHRHIAIAEIWGLLGLRLADDPILPFNYLSYATQLHVSAYLPKPWLSLSYELLHYFILGLEHATALDVLLDEGISLQLLNTSIDELTAAIREAVEEVQKLQEAKDTGYFASLRRRAFNDRLMLAERGFLEAEGLKGRPWFKHLLYSPPEDFESKLSFFPGIADAISQAARSTGKEAHSSLQHEIWRVARAIQRAAAALRGELI
ncbi:hypothetical protein ZIOFF_002996 [Zingiber officinale]|uniref:Transferrin receptor-like dimerisation domain-containing protein n=1 Tax=Zingiber officinale TaxID=94328 RepID=A0A8J5IS58_ZINOF|nr:hypothetical protein ZIOFF_002996 [Zingiber officinale]